MTATLLLGDWNLPHAEVAALAKQMGGTVARGHGPDHAIIVGGQVRDVHVLGKYGSDAHSAVLFELEVEGVEVRALLWNVWVGQRPSKVRRTVRRLARRHRLDVIVLNEAYRCGKELRRVRGFDVCQGPDVGEGADVAVLVARRHAVVRTYPLEMAEGWTVVSKDRDRAGREYRAVRIRLAAGPVLRVLGIHFPTDNRVNAAAVEESKNRVVRWATKSKESS